MLHRVMAGSWRPVGVAATLAMALFAATGVCAGPPADTADTAYVVLGEHGRPVVRAITEADRCPALLVDGHPRPMRLRAAPATEPLRPTQSSPELSKPSAFPVRVCERVLRKSARSASIGGERLPLPTGHANRIVVIGDTGCRLKAKDNAWQACNDPAQYPFARIAAAAAAWKPDLVVHVGDYLYRENPCPDDDAGCAGSPWGYGWDAWNADFFAPARPLLAVAPLALARGNHENCSRAGQGWWRFLDPRPLLPTQDCNDPANDTTGDYSPPYAIPLGRHAQVVIMDLSSAGTKRIRDGDPRIAQFRQTAHALARMSAGKNFTFAVDHYPFFGIGADERKDGTVSLNAGNDALQRPFALENHDIMPGGVDVLLAGHIHLWQQVDFGGRQPSQFVAGFSGTQEDTVPLPDRLPAMVEPAPGVSVRHFSAIVASFGYMTLERTGRRSWNATVHDVAGNILRRCRIAGRRSECTPPDDQASDNPG